ncbi:glycosyltransferase [Oribacterium sp. HCP3S3_B9]|uniref:glycosyltransferase n=1 Tax=Oribacterium sp. HCP3S3_B9 TaxID=3438946 RepID=UPI003F8CD690
MKILEFFGEPISYGGQESFVVNIYNNFSHANSFCFFTPFHADNKELISLTKERRDCVFACNKKFDSKFRKLHILFAAIEAMQTHYDVVHIHSGSVLTLLMVSYIAHKKGIKKVIVHSHATGYETISHEVAKFISDKYIEKNASYYLACSYDAGNYKFPKTVINSNKFQIIKNGIDLHKFSFDEEVRSEKRKELNIVDKKVLCHVGRFSKEKNHEFIISIFEEYLKLENNAILLLIGGAGRNENKIKTMILEKKLSNKVIFLKNRKDINELLCAADVFVFPSQFEGLGISAIEAQANGLPTICASHLPGELNASSVYIKMNLSDGPRKWAEKIYDVQDSKRKSTYSELKMAGYDVADSAKQIENIYMESTS